MRFLTTVLLLAFIGTSVQAETIDDIFGDVAPSRQTGSLVPLNPPNALPFDVEERDTRPRVRKSQIRKQVVTFEEPVEPGTIIISTRERRLYLVTGDGKAIKYGIAVGKQGFSWNGTEKVSRKAKWPEWRPPAEMRKRKPSLPVKMAGGPENPLGARALYLGDTLYRIHGTNEPHTIGKAVSSGSIRMTNDDVIDLYERVPVGSTVIVRP